MDICGSRGCGWNRCEHCAGLCAGGIGSAEVAGVEGGFVAAEGGHCPPYGEGCSAIQANHDWGDQESAASAMVDGGIFGQVIQEHRAVGAEDFGDRVVSDSISGSHSGVGGGG